MLTDEEMIEFAKECGWLPPDEIGATFICNLKELATYTAKVERRTLLMAAEETYKCGSIPDARYRLKQLAGGDHE